jgi:hypothetical protein
MSKGPLVPADETLNHQIVDTFASVGQSDLAWTEKIWLTATARDGSLQVSFGLGKYTNRGVLDGHAGIARGQEQWTVRASRALAPRPDDLSVGPIRYEVVEPLASVRCRLEASEHAPIAFDLAMTGALPPGLEENWPDRSSDGYRVSSDVLRYHQSGVPSGWLELEGGRVEIGPETWVAFRDHSWGTRPLVGQSPAHLMPGSMPAAVYLLYSPMLLERPDGSRYGLFVFYVRSAFGDGRASEQFQAAEEQPTGERLGFRWLIPELRFRNDNRQLLGGVLRFGAPDGSERPITVTPVSETGFHLGAGGYAGYNGYNLGDWRGELHVEGDHVKDTASPDVVRRMHQLRDVLVNVDDPVGGGSGFANVETVLLGAFPELGLSADTTYF